MGGAITSSLGFMPDDIQQGVFEENGEKQLVIWFFGCADYVFAASQQHHQTGFIYRIMQVTPREGMPSALTNIIVPRPQGRILPDQLRLFLSPSASGQTD
jgi:hypothetical protein